VKICSACGESTSNIEKNHEKCFLKCPNTPEQKLERIKRDKADELKVTANSKVCEAHPNDKENWPPHKVPKGNFC
jgi:hypothetical protein